jgi:hypothetical protein
MAAGAAIEVVVIIVDAQSCEGGMMFDSSARDSLRHCGQNVRDHRLAGNMFAPGAEQQTSLDEFPRQSGGKDN